MGRELASTDETAAAAHVHPETLRRLWREGRVPAYQFGRVLRFDLDEVCEALRTTSTSPPLRRTRPTPDFEALS
jgi:excisionase family DNA binding protein